MLGVDIGSDSLKLALCKTKDRTVKKTAVARMPANLLKDGRITSPEAMGELLRNTCRENGIRASKAALVLPNENTYLRTVVMPRMNAAQLVYNLPYEFNDYITDELKNYVFDYAMITDLSQEPDIPAEDASAPGMELMAVAAPVQVLEEAKWIFRQAGLKLVKAAPTVCSYIALIRAAEQIQGGSGAREYCILDLGFRAIRMHMFRGDRHMVTRILEIGLSILDDVIADAYNVDVHLAHTYLVTNHEECQTKELCHATYNNIAVELMRALNFYRFSNPDSQLSDVWLSGGGAVIAPLREAISQTLDIQVHKAEELVQGGEMVENCYDCLQAIGITME